MSDSVYGDVRGAIYGDVVGHVFGDIEMCWATLKAVCMGILGNVQGSIEGEVKVMGKKQWVQYRNERPASGDWQHTKPARRIDDRLRRHLSW